MLKIYTTPTCIYCHALMNWLDEEGIDYEEVDATSDPSITSVPVTAILNNKGQEIARIVGFDRPAIKKVIESLK